MRTALFRSSECSLNGASGMCNSGRFILANTEQLHEKIKSMSFRIRELEDALHELQSGHPLLREDLLLIKKSADLFGVDPNQLQSSGADGNRRSDGQHTSVNPMSPPMLSDVSTFPVVWRRWHG